MGRDIIREPIGQRIRIFFLFNMSSNGLDRQWLCTEDMNGGRRSDHGRAETRVTYGRLGSEKGRVTGYKER